MICNILLWFPFNAMTEVIIRTWEKCETRYLEFRESEAVLFGIVIYSFYAE